MSIILFILEDQRSSRLSNQDLDLDPLVLVELINKNVDWSARHNRSSTENSQTKSWFYALIRHKPSRGNHCNNCGCVHEYNMFVT